MANMKRRQQEEEDSSEESEDETEKRIRMRRMEKEADLKNAEDLFGGLSVEDKKARGAERKATTVQLDPANAASTVDLATLKIFQPNTREQFADLREIVGPLIARSTAKAPYASFAVEFSKAIARDLPSEQIKKMASGLTTLSNEKMKEEKASEKGGRKTKAAKGKVTLNATRDTVGRADTRAYDDGLAE